MDCVENKAYTSGPYTTGHMDCVGNKAHSNGPYTTEGTWTVWGTKPIAVGPIPHRAHGSLCGERRLMPQTGDLDSTRGGGGHAHIA